MGKGDDYAKYQSLTFNAIHQVYLLTKKLDLLIKKQICKPPIFIAATDADEIVSSHHTLQYFHQTQNIEGSRY